LATISYDSQQILADFTKRHGITFPLLSDVGSATIKRYGILLDIAGAIVIIALVSMIAPLIR
jgi:peroxiredoxin